MKNNTVLHFKVLKMRQKSDNIFRMIHFHIRESELKPFEQGINVSINTGHKQGVDITVIY